MYHPNPSRGCGTKKHDSFYGEGGEMAPGGALNAMTWFLGDGLDNVVAVEFPARKIMYGNIAATVACGEVVLADVDYIPSEWERPLYERMLEATKQYGLFDHVGANNYSAHSFTRELSEYGPSRKMSKEQAMIISKLIYRNGPLPIIFSHSRVPVFPNEATRDAMIELVKARYPGTEPQDGYELCPVWDVADWGMYARKGHYTGWRNYLSGVLALVDGIDNDWNTVKNDPIYTEAKSLLGRCIFHEQIFAGSWITQISYTLPENGKFDESLISIPGLNIIDLNAVEETQNGSHV